MNVHRVFVLFNFSAMPLDMMSSIPMPSLSNQLLVGAAVLVLLVIVYAAQNLFLSRLAAVPGPWYAGVSGSYLGLQILLLRQSRAVDAMFAAYGPIVRVSHNAVAVRDMQHAKLVYGFPKAPFYSAFTFMGVRHMSVYRFALRVGYSACENADLFGRLSIQSAAAPIVSAHDR